MTSWKWTLIDLLSRNNLFYTQWSLDLTYPIPTDFRYLLSKLLINIENSDQRVHLNQHRPDVRQHVQCPEQSRVSKYLTLATTTNNCHETRPDTNDGIQNSISYAVATLLPLEPLMKILMISWRLLKNRLSNVITATVQRMRSVPCTQISPHIPWISWQILQPPSTRLNHVMREIATCTTVSVMCDDMSTEQNVNSRWHIFHPRKCQWNH